MAVISPREEQIFHEMTRELSSGNHTSPSDRAQQFRRAALMTLWMVSLLGAFGMVDGRAPMVACALSLAAATFALWSDFIATPAAWELRR